MDNYKFTKGKWELAIDYDHAYSQQVLNISNEIDDCMATVWTGKDSDKEISEETRYNALLISKAPKMLEMLKRCMLEFELYRSEFGQGSKLEKKCKKLIKEATEL